MQQNKWEEITSNIKDNFEIIDERKEDILSKKDDDQKQIIGAKEIIVFNSPNMGRIKLEYIVKPVVLDKKEHYTKRTSTHSTTEYILSDTEFTRRMEAFRWDEANNEWAMIDSSNFN